MKCPKCGSQIKMNANFCGKCGTKVEQKGISKQVAKTEDVLKRGSIFFTSRSKLVIAGICIIVFFVVGLHLGGNKKDIGDAPVHTVSNDVPDDFNEAMPDPEREDVEESYEELDDREDEEEAILNIVEDDPSYTAEYDGLELRFISFEVIREMKDVYGDMFKLDKPALALYFDLINNTGSDTTYMTSFSVSAYQDGKQLITGVGEMLFGASEDAWEIGTTVYPGETLRIARLFTLNSENNVKVEVNRWISYWIPPENKKPLVEFNLNLEDYEQETEIKIDTCIAFYNSTDTFFREVYLSPTSSSDWGDNLAPMRYEWYLSDPIQLYMDYEDTEYDIKLIDKDGQEYTSVIDLTDIVLNPEGSESGVNVINIAEEDGEYIFTLDREGNYAWED